MENTLRCEITGNPCGTDTWVSGTPCLCGNCTQYLMSKQEPLGEEFQKILDEHRWQLYES